MKQITIIGAGPIGLETAIYARTAGYAVSVFEQQTVAANVKDWGHVRLFSPFKMNHSALGVELLKKQRPDWVAPAPDALLTGRQFADVYLQPLSELSQIRDHIHTETRVVSIARENVLKGEYIGRPERTQQPFRILTEGVDGREQVHHADIVIDTSGVYDNPNWLGTGGIPALGERACKSLIDYKLMDVYGRHRAKFANKKTLLVGSGYSAATSVVDFENLIREEPQTSLLWVVRGTADTPIPALVDDPLEGRADLTRRANALAAGASRGIAFRNACAVESIERNANDSGFVVTLKRRGEVETVEVDHILANVGYAPDNSIYRELQVHECYASCGPMKLAATLLADTSGDCLAQESPGAETLKNPEPDFYIIGSKSYGRNSTFLLRTGLQQIVQTFSLITGKAKLNLYETPQTEEVR